MSMCCELPQRAYGSRFRRASTAMFTATRPTPPHPTVSLYIPIAHPTRPPNAKDAVSRPLRSLPRRLPDFIRLGHSSGRVVDPRAWAGASPQPGGRSRLVNAPSARGAVTERLALISPWPRHDAPWKAHHPRRPRGRGGVNFSVLLRPRRVVESASSTIRRRRAVRCGPAVPRRALRDDARPGIGAGRALCLPALPARRGIRPASTREGRLLRPVARRVENGALIRRLASLPGDNVVERSLRATVVDSALDWDGGEKNTRSGRGPWTDDHLELHVGCTRNPLLRRRFCPGIRRYSEKIPHSRSGRTASIDPVFLDPSDGRLLGLQPDRPLRAP